MNVLTPPVATGWNGERITPDALSTTGVIRLANCTFDIAPGTDRPEFTVPNEVIDLTLWHYGRASRYIGANRPETRPILIDLMAGGGSLLKRAAYWGLQGEGIELLPEQSEIARANLPDNIPIITGDCMTTYTPQMNSGYSDAYFSPPFLMMEELAKSNGADLGLALAVARALAPDGLLFIDSAVRAERDGRTLHPVRDTLKYFADRDGIGNFFNSLFTVVAVHPFEIKDPPPGCDSDFAEIVLKKRFPTYQALGGISLLQDHLWPTHVPSKAALR